MHISSCLLLPQLPSLQCSTIHSTLLAARPGAINDDAITALAKLRSLRAARSHLESAEQQKLNDRAEAKGWFLPGVAFVKGCVCVPIGVFGGGVWVRAQAVGWGGDRQNW